MIPLLFLIAFPFLLYSGKKKVWAARASADWPAAPGSITGAVMGKIRLYHKQPRFTYAYKVNGQEFIGTRITYAGVVAPARADEYLARYPVGAPVTVRYQPDAPGQSVIEAGDAELLEQGNRWLIGACVFIVLVNVGSFLFHREQASEPHVLTYGDPGTMSKPLSAPSPASFPTGINYDQQIKSMRSLSAAMRLGASMAEPGGSALPQPPAPPAPLLGIATAADEPEAKSTLVGDYTYTNRRKGRAGMVIDVGVTRTGGKTSVSVECAHPDGSGAAPTGDGVGEVDAGGVFHGTYSDSFDNQGTITFGASKRGYALSIKITTVAEARCLVFYGEHVLTRQKAGAGE